MDTDHPDARSAREALARYDEMAARPLAAREFAFDEALAALDATGDRPGCVVESVEDAERFIDGLQRAIR